MDGERDRRAMAVFEQLADLPAQAWPALLAQQCGGDAELRALVEAMLAADAGTGAPFQGEAASWAAALEAGLASAPATAGAPWPAQTFGAWRVAGVLGQGGMGAVYRVERNDGAYLQQAALKLIRTSADSPLARARFLRERQLLARLHHPNIATLLDGGFSPGGEPYFVMEYVDGEPIDQWCDARRLGLRERVMVFLQVLDAVAHAHRNLVIHRDLKPSNVLVDAEGRVKLLDFGIAKPLEGGEATATGERALTFHYASPEQLHDAPVTTATDLWQLGVVLYRLLTGVHPFGLGRDTPLASQLRQLEREPEPAARAAAAAPAEQAMLRGGLAPAALARALRGSLAGTLQACLRRDPQARYASADALAADLRAYLSSRPIAAVPLPHRQRARLWLRRNRVLAASLAAIALALCAGTGAALWQAQQARQESARTRQSLQLLTDTLAAASPDQAMATQVSVRQLLDSARAALDARTATDAQVKQPVQRLLGRLYTSLGEPRIAVPLFEQGLAGPAPDTREQALALAGDLDDYSTALGMMERGAQALAAARRAAALRARFAPGDPAAMLYSHDQLGYAYYANGDHARAEAEWTQALAVARRMPAPPVDAVINVTQTLASMLAFDGQFKRGLAVADQGLAFADSRHVPADSPHRVPLLRARAEALQKLGDAAAAEPAIRRAIALQRKTTGEGGNRMAALQNALGIVLNDLGRYREALEAVGRGDAIGQAATQAPTERAVSLMNLASVNESAGDYPAALALGRQALAMLDQAGVGRDEPTRRMMERNQARTLGLSGQHAQAQARLLALRVRAQALDGEDSPEYAFLTWQLVVLARQMHDPAQGLPLLAQARTRWSVLVPPAHPVFTHALRAQASFARDRGELAQAEAAQRQAIDRLAGAGALPVDLASARAELAAILAERGDRAGARGLLASALPVLRAAVLPQETSRAGAEALGRRLGLAPDSAAHATPPRVLAAR